MTTQNSKFGKVGFQSILILAVLFLLPFYFIKFKYGWFSLNLVEILIILLFFVWFFSKEKKYTICDTKYFAPILLIFAGLFLSVIANKNYYTGLGVIKGWFLLPIIFAVIFCDNLKRNKKLLSWSLWAIFCSGMLVSVEGIYYWFSGWLTYDGRLRIFFDSPNQLAMFLAPIFLVGIIKFGFEESRQLCCREGKAELWKRGIIIAGICLIGINLYLTKSYGAWLSVGVVSAIVFWLKYREIRPPKRLLIIAIILVILIGAAGAGKLENIKNHGDRSSLASRFMIWKSAGLMIEKNPFFGIGPGNFQNKYLEYQKYFPPYLEWAVPQPHNLFLAFWLEAGLVGFAGFVWLLILFFRDNKKAIGNNRFSGTLCLAIMLYFLIHGLVDTTYWRNDMAVVFWTIVAANSCLAVFLIEKN